MSKASASLTRDEALKKAARLAERGDATGAAALFNAVLARDPGNKKAKKGLRALQSGQATPLTQADFQRVDSLLRRNRIDAARAETQRLLRLHPRQPALHNLLGVILVRLGDREAAVDALQKAIGVDPDFDDALYNLANVLADLKRYPRSLACYEELLKRGRSSPELYNGLGLALRGARRFEEAATAFQRARRMRPLYPDALNNLGNTLNDLGRHDDAINAYEAALEIEPKHRLARLNLARSLVTLKRHAAALPLLAEARRSTADPEILRLYAETLRNLGQRTAAIEVYRELLAKDPNDRVTRHLLDALSGSGVHRADPA
jgi:tetratricopeptide (TPR) repeat protein